jgi:hypothetical protein
VGLPIASANSATQNSAIRGAPSPAMGSSPSHTAAGPMESTECIAAQSTASWNIRTSAASAVFLSSRTAASTADVEFGGGCHGSSQALTTDTQTPETRLYTGC